MSHLIVWKDSFSIDGGLIDNDHRYLILLINEILEGIKDGEEPLGVRRNIGRLRCFARLHFDREEVLQTVAGFEHGVSHALLHTDLIDQLDEAIEIAEGLAKRGACHDVDARAEDCDRMKTFLYRWLLVHILQEDAKMRPYVGRMRGAWGRFPPLHITGLDIAS
ncbi:MAG: hemerythrin family protein [Hyphomicrobiales bacterium]